ncbi:MAG: carboxylesterase family protein, partial [Bacteroidales bacterium]|nr:carboxylesterase family protein [Bacteroidales bacterium]
MKNFFLSAALTLAVALPLGAVNPADTLSARDISTVLLETPAKLAGNHYNYPFEPYSVAPAPKGYKPVYISHYGRHGARFATSASKYDTVMDAFIEGHDKSMLTAEGENLYRRLLEVYPHLKGHEGDLTVVGQNQHRELARRMAAAYPEVLGKKVKVDARATISPRAIVSMMSFCDELRRICPGMELEYGADTPDLAYTALADPVLLGKDPAAIFGLMRDALKDSGFGKYYGAQYIKNRETAKEILSRYFEDLSFSPALKDPMNLCSSLFEIAVSMQNLDFKADLSGLFTEEEELLLWEHSNLYGALMFMGNPYTKGAIPANAWPLLEQIIRSADSDLAGKGVSVRLRFGHDTVVAPLMGLLGVEGWESLGPDPGTWKYHFQNWNIPMASNAQFIFYANKKRPGDVLVRVMYNEKDCILPLPDQSLAPYYRWEDFKAFYRPVCDRARATVASAMGNPVVEVDGGKILGVKEDDVIVYRGVPFATPPLGELRDKPLQPVQPWEGIFKADRFPDAATQSGVSKEDPLYYKEFYTGGYAPTSDDCMYVNIWAPASAIGHPEAKLPVAFWIHGGAFKHGYSFEISMDGDVWAKRGVILVTIPYRLGDLGFGTDEMLGFQDQIFALEWVRDNISAFGGDPSNVTIFGGSAGAISVKHLFTMPEAQPLFAKGIMQSGGGVNRMDSPA